MLSESYWPDFAGNRAGEASRISGVIAAHLRGDAVEPGKQATLVDAGEIELVAEVVDDAAFQAFHRWRRQVATSRRTMPYRILPGQLLVELARVCPTNYQELLLVQGLGRIRAARYGDELIAIGQELKRVAVGA